MDMGNTPNPVILHLFYTNLFTEGWVVLLAVLVALLARWTRRVQGARRENASGEAGHAYLSRAVPAPEPGGRAALRIGLGLLWILDGLLQAQPSMATAFLSNVIAPLISGQPAWEASLLRLGIEVWGRHPIGFDLFSVWLQIGVGLAILFGKDRFLGRTGLWISILWSAAIWVFGEGLGGLAAGTATWLSGAPGSAVFYGLGAALLLLPAQRWTNGSVRRYAQIGSGALWLVLAACQAWPPAGYWTSQGLSGGVLDMAQMQQPAFFSAPLQIFAGWLAAHPVLWNGAFTLIMAALGAVWLTRPRSNLVRWATLAWIGSVWWLGQDFGVLGGVGTDPNSGPPLALLTFAAGVMAPLGTGTGKFLAALSDATRSSAPQTRPVRAPRMPNLFGRVRRNIGVSRGRKIAFASAISGLAALAAAVALYPFGPFRPSASNAQAAILDGGLTPIGNRPAPNFTLVNQYGRRTSLSDFRGKAVVLTFLDPVCYDTCPVMANEMALADKALGARANQVELIAVCANPVFHSVRDIQAFDREHGLTNVANWQYLTSPSLPALQRVWAEYYVYVHAPKVGMVDHSQVLYFLSPSGKEMWLSGDSGTAALSSSYTSLIASYAEKSLSAG